MLLEHSIITFLIVILVSFIGHKNQTLMEVTDDELLDLIDLYRSENQVVALFSMYLIITY